MKLIYFLLISLCLHSEVIDSVIATIDNQPILLSDLNKELGFKLTSFKAIKGTENEKVLEQMINKTLLELEAKRLNINVSETEIQNYINDLKIKNNLTDEQLLEEIKKQNLTYNSYVSQIRLEYLRSKIAGTLARSGKAVSSSEIQSYLDSHPEINKPGEKLLISQIVINKTGRTYETAKALIYGIYDSLLTSDFKKQVLAYSEAPDAKRGGSLGILVKEDLSNDVKYKLEYLNVGEFSAPLEDANTFRIFKVEGKIESENELKTQVQNILKQQNLGLNLEEYFKTEIYRFHSVEKKY